MLNHEYFKNVDCGNSSELLPLLELENIDRGYFGIIGENKSFSYFSKEYRFDANDKCQILDCGEEIVIVKDKKRFSQMMKREYYRAKRLKKHIYFNFEILEV